MRHTRQQVVYQLFPTGLRRANVYSLAGPRHCYLTDSLQECEVAFDVTVGALADRDNATTFFG